MTDLIAQSNRYKDFFWRMPKAGIAPSSPGVVESIVRYMALYALDNDQDDD